MPGPLGRRPKTLFLFTSPWAKGLGRGPKTCRGAKTELRTPHGGPLDAARGVLSLGAICPNQYQD